MVESLAPKCLAPSSEDQTYLSYKEAATKLFELLEEVNRIHANGINPTYVAVPTNALNSFTSTTDATKGGFMQTIVERDQYHTIAYTLQQRLNIAHRNANGEIIFIKTNNA